MRHHRPDPPVTEGSRRARPARTSVSRLVAKCEWRSCDGSSRAAFNAAAGPATVGASNALWRGDGIFAGAIARRVKMSRGIGSGIPAGDCHAPLHGVVFDILDSRAMAAFRRGPVLRLALSRAVSDPSAGRPDRAAGRFRSDRRGSPGEPSAAGVAPRPSRSPRLPSSRSCRPAGRTGGFRS